MGLNLSTKAIESLEEYSEGWIAAIQLITLSMQQKQDTGGDSVALGGKSRYLVSYLVEEVLRHQPEHIQRFLLRTALLERLNAPLCQAITDQAEAQAMLEYLEQANLFTIALDERRSWYRYHHLFGELLYLRLQQTYPEQVAPLHQRAAQWYEEHGYIVEAMRHWLPVSEFERAATLIERNGQQMLMRGESTTLLRWIEALSKQIIDLHPRLKLGQIEALAFSGQLVAAENHLQDLEAILFSETTDQRMHSNASQQAMKDEMIAIQALIAGLRQDSTRFLELARPALERLPLENTLPRGILGTGVRQATLFQDDAAATCRAVEMVINRARQNRENIHTVVEEISTLAYQLQEQGQLRRATEAYQQALNLTQGGPAVPSMCLAYVGLGEIAREWNELEQATRYLEEAINQGRQLATPGVWMGRIHLVLALVKQAQGSGDEALALIQEAEQFLREQHMFFPIVTSGAARAQLELARGNIDRALQWAQASEKVVTGLGEALVLWGTGLFLFIKGIRLLRRGAPGRISTQAVSTQ